MLKLLQAPSFHMIYTYNIYNIQIVGETLALVYRTRTLSTKTSTKCSWRYQFKRGLINWHAILGWIICGWINV